MKDGVKDMTIKNHPEYSYEKTRLSETLNYLSSYYKDQLTEKLRLDKAVDFDSRHFNSDSSQQYIDLMINTRLQDNLKLKLKNLQNALDKPYFARVDFMENGGTLKKLYIGKVSLQKGNEDDYLILDWRAPVSNLYYEGRIGTASYECLEGEISGEISLKRQYTIDHGELKDFFDIDITTNDEFLQACLNVNADNRLKNIVSTIQQEQNKIIRADMWTPLIVQGAAGGGKTTIALHRIAYLLYAYESSLSPWNFMIIAPNKFFLSYISEVLPELGVENVRQHTFEDLALDLLDKNLELTDNMEKLSCFINHTLPPYLSASSPHALSFRQLCNNDEELLRERIKYISSFKSSLEYKNLLEVFLEKIEDSLLPQEDFVLHNRVLWKKEQLQQLFLTEYKALPIRKRINEIRKHLRNSLKRAKPEILEEIVAKGDRKIEELRSAMEDSEERRRLITQAADERDSTLHRVKEKASTLVRDYLKGIVLKDTLIYYEAFTETLPEAFRFYNHSLREEGLYELEDLPPLLYIMQFIYGIEGTKELRQIVIDEAQDFSIFQLFIMKKLFSSCSFTILGDLCQGIHSYRGIKDWDTIVEGIFHNKAQYLTLVKSYRTTTEILLKANEVIHKLKDGTLKKAEPVLRHGEEVAIIKSACAADTARSIYEDIKGSKEFKSFAIIGKHIEECSLLHSELSKLGLECTLISGKEDMYSGGIVVLPCYLSKGLEFDKVFIANASSDLYTMEERDIKLLYVAMTRALHCLNIYYEGELSPLLKRESAYELNV